MPIVVGTGSSSSSSAGLTTYLELRASVEAWLNRADLAARVPDFIKLLEAELNRVLRVPEMEAITTLTASATVTLPTDFREVRTLTVDTDPRMEMIAAPIHQIEAFYEANTSGIPRYFAITGDTIKLGPEPTTGFTLRLDYYQDIPALTATNTSNWVLSKHPDIYLYGTLLMAEAYIFNDERLPLWRSAFDNSISQLKGQGISKRHGGALVARVPNAP